MRHAILALRTNRRGSARSSSAMVELDRHCWLSLRAWWCWPSPCHSSIPKAARARIELSLMLKAWLRRTVRRLSPRSVRRDDHGNWFYHWRECSGNFVANVDGLSVKVPKSSSNASTVDSSLRVEEVGTIHLTVGGTHFQSTLTQLTDFATTDGGFVASTQSHMGTKATHSYSTGSIVLQVPERNFTMLVDQVRHAGVATSVVTSATDVTGSTWICKPGSTRCR